MESPTADRVRIDCAFPGGNIIVEVQEGSDVRIHQDLRDTAGNWFYWCFRVRGAAGRTLRFYFTESRAIGARGPAVSLDGGASWRWLGFPDGPPNSFAYTFETDEARFSFGMPYQVEHWQAFTAALPAGSGFFQEELCRSRKGRPVPLARFGCQQSPDHRVALTCRHHCCEMMANYVLEGLIRFILTDADPEAVWLRTKVGFWVVPFVDMDGSEDGDQGKNRKPRDHGRDYAGESIYPETRAVREQLPVWSDGSLSAAIDLHCPWMADGRNEQVYLVGSPDSRVAEQQVVFSKLLEACTSGPIPVSASQFLAFGQEWNVASNTTQGLPFPKWAAALPGVKLATGIETPYANAGGAEVNAATARAFGADVARTLAAYLCK